MATKALVAALLLATALSARDHIAYIEFFGYSGIDVDAVRRALPFHEGDQRSKKIDAQAREAVRRVTGREATDVNQVCCVGDGDAAIFIGLPGESTRRMAYQDAPKGEAAPPHDLVVVYRKVEAAEMAAMRRGVFAEDGSPGYRLLKDPGAAAAELALRAYALKHEDEIVRTLQGDRRADNRALAADVLGYGARTPRQIAALVRAVRDPDDDVRNNATRALGEILRADVSAGAEIPVAPFLDLVRSGIWTDRNKGSMVLCPLTQQRDAQMLKHVNSEAGDALTEMARWRPTGWSAWPRLILGRIAGIPEDKLEQLADGPADAFFAAIGR
jgi:hypothetical protein